MPHQTAHGDTEAKMAFTYITTLLSSVLWLSVSVCLQDIKSYWQNEPNYVDGKHKEDLVKDTEFGL